MACSPARGRVDRWSRIAALTGGLIVACGSSAPAESAIYHDPALRPGAVDPAGEDERELLGRLASLPGARSVRIGTHTFVLEPGYAAASGRRCRAVSTEGRRRLACEGEDGWVFVPDVHGDSSEATP